MLSMGITKYLRFSPCPHGATSDGPTVYREFIAVLDCPPSHSYFIDFMDPILTWVDIHIFLRGLLADLWWLVLVLPVPQIWVLPFQFGRNILLGNDTLKYKLALRGIINVFSPPPKLSASERNFLKLVESVGWVRSKRDLMLGILGMWWVEFYLCFPSFFSNCHQNEFHLCGHFRRGLAFNFRFYNGKGLIVRKLLAKYSQVL